MRQTAHEVRLVRQRALRDDKRLLRIDIEQYYPLQFHRAGQLGELPLEMEIPVGDVHEQPVVLYFHVDPHAQQGVGAVAVLHDGPLCISQQDQNPDAAGQHHIGDGGDVGPQPAGHAKEVEQCQRQQDQHDPPEGCIAHQNAIIHGGAQVFCIGTVMKLHENSLFSGIRVPIFPSRSDGSGSSDGWIRRWGSRRWFC